MHIFKKKGSFRLGLSFVFILSYPALALVQQAWRAEYSDACECDSSLDEAISAHFSNRLPDPDKVAHLLDVETSLIDGFVASKKIPNSKKVILWSVYELGAYDIANALIRAANAGVEVHVMTDGKSVTKKPEDLVLKDNKDKKEVDRSVDRNALTRDIFALLKKNGKIILSYSDPEWVPVSTGFSPLMHEKVRLFAKKKADALVPLFAYVSTHNDTFSDTIGDPLSGLDMDRLRKGKLKRSELVPDSSGNIQTSMIIRHNEILQSLTKNFLDQEKIYGLGKGRIFNVPNQDIATYKLEDGTSIRLFYTYAKRTTAYNPNILQADFITKMASGESNEKIVEVNMTEFVFSYGKVGEALKLLQTRNPAPLDIAVDGNFAILYYSRARPMAGLFTVVSGRPIDYPWPKDARRLVNTTYYKSGQDKLHVKNTFIHYTDESGNDRYLVFTGSINLSSNAVSNKELGFEIDSPSDSVFRVNKLVQQALKEEGRLRDVSEMALLYRLLGVARTFGTDLTGNEEAERALKEFLRKLNSPSARANSKAWLPILEKFYLDVGVAEEEISNILKDVSKNLKLLPTFYPSLRNIEALLVLTEDKETLDPKTRRAVLNLFDEPKGE